MTNIYGFFNGEICEYIGVSERDYNTRINEHVKALEKNVHKNKSLQKVYNKCKESGQVIEGRLLKSIECNSTLIKFFLEGLYNSYYKPKCNKIVVSQGKNNIVLSRCDKDLAERLLDVF